MDPDLKPLSNRHLQDAEVQLYVVCYGNVIRLVCSLVMGLNTIIATRGLTLFISVPKCYYHTRKWLNNSWAYTKCTTEMKNRSTAYFPRPYWATFWTIVQTLLITWIATKIRFGELLIGVDCIVDTVLGLMIESTVGAVFKTKAAKASYIIQAPKKKTFKNGLQIIADLFWRTTLHPLIYISKGYRIACAMKNYMSFGVFKRKLKSKFGTIFRISKNSFVYRKLYIEKVVYEDGQLKQSLNVKAKMQESVNVAIQLKESLGVNKKLQEGMDMVEQMKQGLNVTNKLKDTFNVNAILPEGLNVVEHVKQSVNVNETLQESANAALKLKDSLDVNKKLQESMEMTEQLKQSLNVTDKLKESLNMAEQLKGSLNVAEQVKSNLNLAGQLNVAEQLKGKLSVADSMFGRWTSAK